MTREYFQNAAEDWGAEKLAITRCNLQFDEIAHYGKKHAVLKSIKRPQDVVVGLSLLHPGLLRTSRRRAVKRLSLK